MTICNFECDTRILQFGYVEMLHKPLSIALYWQAQHLANVCKAKQDSFGRIETSVFASGLIFLILLLLWLLTWSWNWFPVVAHSDVWASTSTCDKTLILGWKKIEIFFVVLWKFWSSQSKRKCPPFYYRFVSIMFTKVWAVLYLTTAFDHKGENPGVS